MDTLHSSSESSEAMISRSGCCVPARAVAAVCAPALADAAGKVAAVCVPYWSAGLFTLPSVFILVCGTIHMTTQELSSSGARRCQEQSVVKQRGMMHSSEAMISQSGCLCSSPRSRCCLCSSPRRRCRRSRCRLCSSPRRRCRCCRGQRCLPRLCRGSAHGETDLITGELDRRSWQRECVCSTVLIQTTIRILAPFEYAQKSKIVFPV